MGELIQFPGKAAPNQLTPDQEVLLGDHANATRAVGGVALHLVSPDTQDPGTPTEAVPPAGADQAVEVAPVTSRSVELAKRLPIEGTRNPGKTALRLAALADEKGEQEAELRLDRLATRTERTLRKIGLTGLSEAKLGAELIQTDENITDADGAERAERAVIDEEVVDAFANARPALAPAARLKLVNKLAADPVAEEALAGEVARQREGEIISEEEAERTGKLLLRALDVRLAA